MNAAAPILPIGTPVVIDSKRETERRGTVAGHALLFDRPAGGRYVYLVDLGPWGFYGAGRGSSTFVRVLVCDVGCVSPDDRAEPPAVCGASFMAGQVCAAKPGHDGPHREEA